MDGDFEKAGEELENHLTYGGDLDGMMEEINKAVSESGFSLSQTERGVEESLGQGAEEKRSSSAPGSKQAKSYKSIKNLILKGYLPEAFLSE